MLYAVSVSRDACKRDGTNEQNVATVLQQL